MSSASTMAHPDRPQSAARGHAVPLSPAKQVSKILLLDGYSTRSLACVRSWGKNGVAFALGGESRRDMSLFSRYARETFVYTSPKQDVAKFIQDVNTCAHKFGADAIFPTSEAAIMACSQHRGELACRPIIPQEQQITTTFSKANTLQIAESLGIAVPKTVHITSQNCEILPSLAMEFPVAIKSESSEVMQSGKASTSQKTFYANDQNQLEQECRARLARGQSVLLQQFIEGYGAGISGLFDQGRPVALIGHRRVRESNPLGGPSALAETIEMEPRLLQPSLALLGKIGLTGPAMVEYKVDRRSGQPYLMEINGRFWGSILLASAAGLELPYLYWKMLNGMEISSHEKAYRIGVRGRYLVGDTKCLLLCLKGKPRHWPGEMASRGAALRSYLSSFWDQRTVDLILTRDDPMPFLGRLIQPNS
jgi:predicted ATP-grasp superfamily ATP-dependent carboligase